MNKIVADKCDYDLQNDSIFLYVKDKKYSSSIDANGIILDFSEDDNNIINLEVLDASKKFNVPKSELLNIKHFDATVSISKENIKITMKLGVLKRNQLLDRCLEALTLNIFNLPARTQGIAVTC